MSQAPSQGPVVEVRPQPNVYTILLLVAVVALVIAIGMCYWRLTSDYGMTIGQFFEKIKPPAP